MESKPTGESTAARPADREPLTVTISGLGARFGNRGGSILLVDGHGQVVHIARYTRRMAAGGPTTELLR